MPRSIRTMVPFVLVALLAGACGSATEGDAASAADQTAASPQEEAAPAASLESPPKENKVTSIPAPSDVSAAPSDASTTASGLAYKILTEGSGTEHPKADSSVEVHYTGWTTDGKMFDSSVVRGETISFPLNGVIKGWTEGVQLMTVGDKARFWIPGNLAYGDTPTRQGAPAGTLVFDIELFGIINPPTVPEDVAAAPADATTTESGLAYKVLTPGTGTEHPSATSSVTVHYSGWTTDGQMFDSSVARGKTISFPLNRVIPGWTEGLQLMVTGEKTRFWIPGKLAYGETPKRPGAPAGTLVFDVELVSFE